MPDLRDKVDKQVQDSVAAGARVLTGGRTLDGPGSFYAPTVLTDIPQDSPAYQEELFGPSPCCSVSRTSTPPSHSPTTRPSAWAAASGRTTQPSSARCIDEIEAGMVFVNSMVASDPRLPFGGIKHSGYGRELSAEGIREFVNLKTVFIKEERRKDRGGDGMM